MDGCDDVTLMDATRYTVAVETVYPYCPAWNVGRHRSVVDHRRRHAVRVCNHTQEAQLSQWHRAMRQSDFTRAILSRDFVAQLHRATKSQV